MKKTMLMLTVCPADGGDWTFRQKAFGAQTRPVAVDFENISVQEIGSDGLLLRATYGVPFTLISITVSDGDD